VVFNQILTYCPKNRFCYEIKVIAMSFSEEAIHKQGKTWVSGIFFKKNHFCGLPRFERSSRSQ
jgi:hypothetical protein